MDGLGIIGSGAVVDAEDALQARMCIRVRDAKNFTHYKARDTCIMFPCISQG
jgi:hypothetical protein